MGCDTTFPTLCSPLSLTNLPRTRPRVINIGLLVRSMGNVNLVFRVQFSMSIQFAEQREHGTFGRDNLVNVDLRQFESENPSKNMSSHYFNKIKKQRKKKNSVLWRIFFRSERIVKTIIVITTKWSVSNSVKVYNKNYNFYRCINNYM